MLEHPNGGAETIEKTMGLLWSVTEDTITAIPRYNLFGSSRGKELGPPLKDMTEEEVQKMSITRMTFLRISAQTYNKMANILGPLMFSCKVLSSRACELATVDELEEDLESRDSGFVTFCKSFILNIRNVDRIIPFPRCWTPEGYNLIGFITSLDGGKSGYGATIHAIAERTSEIDDPGTSPENEEEDVTQGQEKNQNHFIPTPQSPAGVEQGKELLRSLAITRSKISKRNVVSHEVLAGKLSGEALQCLLQPLAFDFWDKELLLPFKIDSTCFLAMLNSQIELKNMLLTNAVASFKEELIKISSQFPRALITVGHIPGSKNPADSLTKLYKDPIEAINSVQYRFGPNSYGSREKLEEDVVATCQNGNFVFLGLPAKFLVDEKVDKEECRYCHEKVMFCALARTRAQAKMEKKEDEKDSEDPSSKETMIDETNDESTSGRESLVEWLNKLKARLCLGDGNNLIDHNYDYKTDLILTRETYLRWINKFFSLGPLFRTSCILAGCDLSRKRIDFSTVDIKKEGCGLLLRSAQTHFMKDIEKMSDSEIQGVKTMSLRLQSHTARELYGTRFLPVLGSEDPLRYKVIRMGHELGPGTNRRTHNLEKTTSANLLRGQMGVTWKTETKDVKNFAKTCGVCLKFRKEKCRPPLGKSLFRVKTCTQPFGHLSLDPIGAIRVRGSGTQTQKLYPLVLVCLESGGTHVELMTGLEARDVYLSILRLQYRYNTVVTQLFSDGGSQLDAKLLGQRRNFYQKSLKKLWGVHNNTPYSQFRNIAERKISVVKRLIKEGIFGIPGPQQEPVDKSILETAILGATNMVNNTPYQDVGPNSTLLCPADFLTPWKGQEPEVQCLPENKLKSLLETRRKMIIKQEKLKEIMMEEIRNEVNRFRGGQLKLGNNKNSPNANVGGVVLLDLEGQTPQLGVAMAVSQRDVRVRKKNGSEVTLAIGQCVPITPGISMASREGETFTHFLSMEIRADEHLNAFQKNLKDLQSRMKEVSGVGKPSKPDSLHITMATIRVNPTEMEEVMRKTEVAFQSYVDLLNSSHGVNVTFREIGHGDHGVIWLNVSLGSESVKVLRELLEDKLAPFITDSRFHPHMTIFRKCDLSEELKEGVRTAVKEVRMESVNLERITLREKKSGPIVKEPLLTMSLSTSL